MYRGIIALFLGAALVLAQETNVSTPTLQVADNEEYGIHLVNGQGYSLYMYIEDTENASNCTDQCAQNWPPLTVEGEPSLGEGVGSALVGTLERQDGTLQVTYNGRPLYRYARDANPGDIRGQKLGNAFFLVDAQGEGIMEKVVREAPQINEDEFAALVSEGGRVFANNCAVCHGPEGQGKIGPNLAGNSVLADSNFVINRVLNGFPEHGMPPFRDQLSDRQIAAVATFVRNSWSNEFGAVTEEEVSELR